MFEELTDPGISAPGKARPTRVRTYGLPVVMTIDEAAEFLRMNRKTVYAAIAAGEIPGSRIGKRVVILRDALLSWMRSNGRVLSSRTRRK